MRYLKRLLELDYRQMWDKIKRIKKRSGRSYFFIIYDIIRCSRKFGSGYIDYCNFHFEELSDELKATYVTRMVNDDYCKLLNDPSYYDVVNDKATFLKIYHDFAKRDYLDLRQNDKDAFTTFIHHHSLFMAKPVDQLCGKGIEKIDSRNFDDEELYERLIKQQQFLLEELIIQDDTMASLNPSSINTIRIVTILKNDKVYMPFMALRMGRSGVVVDNFNHGGLNALINEKGEVYTLAVTKDEREYEYHPDSHVKIKGFKIPHFAKLLETADAIARVTPELGMCGWDFCIAKDKGIVAIEGNHLPGYDLYQCYGQRPIDKRGKKPLFDSIIYGDK